MERKENEILRLLIVSSIYGEALSSDVLAGDIDWSYVFSEIDSQGLANLTYDVVSGIKAIDEDIMSLWRVKAFYTRIFTIKQLIFQEKLFELFDCNNILAVVIKGTSAAINYNNPNLKASGDIDLFVGQKNYSVACELLLKQGYSIIEETSYHTEFDCDGITVEIHSSLARIGLLKRNKDIGSFLEKGLVEREKVHVLGHDAYVFPPIYSGIVLLMHIQQHMPSGIGFRQIIDWQMYVDKCLDDKMWEQFLGVYEQFELVKPAILVTKMCQIYLNLDEENITWSLKADEKSCDELYWYVFLKGDFGKKENSLNRGVHALTRDTSFREAISTIIRHGVKSEKIVSDKKIYKIKAIFLICFRYTKFVFSRKKPIRSLVNDITESKERKRLLMKMNIYEHTTDA